MRLGCGAKADKDVTIIGGADGPPMEYSIHIRLLKAMQIYSNIMRPGMKRISQKCIEAERH